MIAKTRVILERTTTAQLADGLLCFIARSEDYPAVIDYAAALPMSTWEGMGRPETLTVTIEPGDQLNPVIVNTPADEPAPA